MNKMGVYVITQISTGIVYVGSSVHIDRRWKRHISDLNCGRHHCLWLQRVWLKHANDFAFSVIEEVEEKGLLIEREVFWLSRFVNVFNGEQPDIERGVLSHGEETRAKMSVSQRRRFALHPPPPMSEKQRKQIGDVHRGKVVSLETRAKQSASAKTRPPVSQETREKLRQSNFRRVYGPISEEQKEKLSKAHTGKILTPEHRKKIGVSLSKSYAEGRR